MGRIIKVTAMLSMCIFLHGCSSRVLEFSAISTRPVVPNGLSNPPYKLITAQPCRSGLTLLLYPVTGPDMTTAIAAAVEREKADLLTHVSVMSRKHVTFFFGVFAFEECTSVTGDAARAIPFDVNVPKGDEDNATTR
jgi:hypothetical protein